MDKFAVEAIRPSKEIAAVLEIICTVSSTTDLLRVFVLALLVGAYWVRVRHFSHWLPAMFR